MADYTRAEARDWAMSDMEGVCGCLLPTFNASLTRVNESAVRHDMRMAKEFGYWGNLLVTECGTTVQEMREVMEISVDEAQKVGIRTMLLASYASLPQILEEIGFAESAGVDMVMVSYPLNFRPSCEDEVFEFTKAIADASDLGVMLFCIHHWDFGRLHPSGFSPRLMERLVDACPTVVSIKNEIGHPGVGGQTEVFERFNDRVVVSDPFEQNSPAWIKNYDMKFMGTANYEYMGKDLVRYFDLLRAGDFDAGMEAFWKVHPARQASVEASTQTMAGTNYVHRLMWKYKGWLAGCNGGPVRGPHARLSDAQMRRLRSALVACGIEPAAGDDTDFFAGRNPED